MKEWQKPELKTLDIEETAKNNGNNDTHTHKGWCNMHKHPELGCNCGAGIGILS